MWVYAVLLFTLVNVYVYKSHPRPFKGLPQLKGWVYFINAWAAWLGWIAGNKGWWVDLRAETMMKRASASTKLSDFGALWPLVKDNYQKLIDSLRHEANLSFIGQLSIREQLYRKFILQLNVQQQLSLHGDIIRAEHVRKPVFILGLPRTGTTLLYGLMAKVTVHAVLTFWEGVNPVLPEKDIVRGRDTRISTAEKVYKKYQLVIPESVHALHHLEDHLGPEECGFLLRNSFGRSHELMFFDMPSYAKHLDSSSDEIHYDYYKLQLQILQYQRRILATRKAALTGSPAPADQRMLMKCPFHLPSMHEILRCFPDACIIWTHRDATQVVPSACSLTAHFTVAGSDVVEPNRLGKEWNEWLSTWVNKAVTIRDEIRSGTIPVKTSRTEAQIFYDVQYNTFVKDPISKVRQIYEHFGLEFTAEFEKRMNHYLQSNPQGKHGKHTYSCEQFGLQPEDVRSKFALYHQRYLS